MELEAGGVAAAAPPAPVALLTAEALAAMGVLPPPLSLEPLLRQRGSDPDSPAPL